MSISTELTRLQTARNKLRTKLIALGLVTAAAKLDDCAAAVDGITNQGAVSATVWLAAATTSSRARQSRPPKHSRPLHPTAAITACLT